MTPPVARTKVFIEEMYQKKVADLYKVYKDKIVNSDLRLLSGNSSDLSSKEIENSINIIEETANSLKNRDKIIDRKLNGISYMTSRIQEIQNFIDTEKLDLLKSYKNENEFKEKLEKYFSKSFFYNIYGYNSGDIDTIELTELKNTRHNYRYNSQFGEEAKDLFKELSYKIVELKNEMERFNNLALRFNSPRQFINALKMYGIDSKALEEFEENYSKNIEGRSLSLVVINDPLAKTLNNLDK